MHRYNSPSTGWKNKGIACLCFILASASMSLAAEWTNGGGNNIWHNSLNWDPQAVPTSGTVYINNVDETDDDYCLLDYDVTISGLYLNNDSSSDIGSGAKLIIDNSFEMNVLGAVQTGVYQRGCELVVTGSGILNTCISGGYFEVGKGTCGSVSDKVADSEYATLTVDNGTINCAGNFYLGRNMKHSKLNLLDGAINVIPDGPYYPYQMIMAEGDDCFAEADIYGTLTCTSTNGFACTLQIGSSSYSGSAPQAIMTIHGGGS